MRLRTSLLTTSLVLVALSLPPASADATAEPGCHVQDVEWEGLFGTNRVEVAHNCRATVTLNEGIICLGGSVDRDQYDVQGNTVVVYSCGNPNQGGGLGDLIALSAAAPRCNPGGFHAETVLGGLYVSWDEDCRVGVSLGDGGLLEAIEPTVDAPDCDPAGTHAETVLGGVYVGIDENCLPDVRGPNRAAASVPPPPCPPNGPHVDTFFGGIAFGFGTGCTPSVHIQDNGFITALCPGDVYLGGGLGVDFEEPCTPHPTGSIGNDCLGGGGSTKVLYDDGYLHVSYTSCPNTLPDITTTSAANAAAPSCEKVPGTAVHDDCAVYLRFMECVWGGYYRPVVEQGWVRVYVYTCGPPPTTQDASASAAPCSVLPDAGSVTVSDDCMTITNKPYDCVWGGYWVTYRAGPVTYREYRCGPPPATSASMADPFPTCVRECTPPLPNPCPLVNAPADAVVDDPVMLRVRSDCTFELGLFDGAVCVGDWGNTSETDVGGNTVRVTVCDGGLGHRLGELIEPADAASATPCNGFYYFEETVGPVTVWSSGLRCTGARLN